MPEYLSTELDSVVNSPDFWTNLFLLIRLIHPINSVIERFQSNETISNVFHQWTELETHYKTNRDNSSDLRTKRLMSYICECLDARWDLISDDIHAAAYFMDPRFRGKLLEEPDFDDAERFLTESCGIELETEIFKFRGEGIYSRRCAINEDPILYWKKLCQTKESAKLAELAVELLNFPQSSAAIERTFSAIRHIQLWKRSSLHRDTLENPCLFM